MTDKRGQFDDEFDAGVSDEFSADLKSLFGNRGQVPGHVDRAVMRHARKRLTRSSRLAVLRWVGSAAAMIAIVSCVYFMNFMKQDSPMAMEKAVAVSANDIDGSGSVDILDAFKLARHIESDNPFEARLDINGDGNVDQQDVETIAFAAVNLNGVKP